MGKKKRTLEETADASDSSRVPTLASKASLRPPPEVVVFTEPKVKQPKTEVVQSDSSKKKTEEADLIRLKRDVHKFSVAGMEKSKQEESKIAQLIRLGAKPPKNKAVAYDQLKKQRKWQREEEKKKKELDRKLGLQVSTYRPQRKKDKNKVKGFFSQLGRPGTKSKKQPGKKGKRKSKM